MKRTLSVVVAVASLLLMAGTAPAQTTVIAYTSFELASAPAGVQYVDTGSAATDHPLLNNAGQPDVNFVASGGEIGFTSYYWNTRGDVGLTDGDWVGASSYLGDVGAFPDGLQGFEISDADGKMTTTMDTLDLTGITDPVMSIEWFIKDDGWEIEDVARIWVTVEPGGVEIDLLNTAGFDIDDLLIEGVWWYSEVDLSGYTSVTMAFELDCNASYEAMYFDNIQLVGIPSVADEIFSDGFETGNTDGWTSVVP